MKKIFQDDRVKLITQERFNEIEEFLTNNFSSPTHWPEYNLIISKHFNTSFYYLGLFEDAQLIGICPIHQCKRGILSDYRSGHFWGLPFGGWIFSKPTSVQYKKLKLAGLYRYEVMSLPLLNDFNNTIPYHESVKKKTLIIDLSLDLNTIWEKQFNYRRRRGVRKSEKSNVSIHTGIDSLESFYTLYKESSTRLGLSLMPIELFSDALKKTSNVGFEFITAKLDEKALANLVIPFDKNYSFYWLGNSFDNTPNLGQNELLHWEAIKIMKSRGCKYYDLCMIDLERLPGIYEFKSGFSQNEVLVHYVSSKSLFYKSINRISRVFRHGSNNNS